MSVYLTEPMVGTRPPIFTPWSGKLRLERTDVYMGAHGVEVTDLEAQTNSSLGLIESGLVGNPLHDFPFQTQERHFSRNRFSYVTTRHKRSVRVVGAWYSPLARQGRAG